MIELVYEIRRFSPSELKPAVKLANPELFDELKVYYHASASVVSKALIKELFLLAGDEWPSRLAQVETPQPKQRLKIYRGLTMHEDAKTPSHEKNKTVQKKKPKRIYRGQVIE